MDKILEKLKSLQDLSYLEIRFICSKSTELLMYEPNVPYISTPVNVVGDIHGQYYDLLNLFSLFGAPSDAKYIFLGDYVDRGMQSIEVYLTLLVYKIMFPNRVFLVRGNHEIKTSGKSSFRDECHFRYDDKIYRLISDTFYYLLIGCVIDGRMLCVHGGISPDCVSVGEMQLINRFSKKIDPRFNNIMWSDPGIVNKFLINPRGAGYIYGEEQVKGFLAINNLNYLIRAHQMCFDGFAFHFKYKNCLTVWSAPNYIYSYGNLASVLKLKGEAEITSKEIRIFRDVHKFYNQYKPKPQE
ncbi:hypothetical protein GVAV_000166 [Gurleya vavrai]